jgi:hypothetical protein
MLGREKASPWRLSLEPGTWSFLCMAVSSLIEGKRKTEAHVNGPYNTCVIQHDLRGERALLFV